MNNELMHYGILGMKWGRRKASHQTSDDYSSVKKLRKKHYSEMSNDELQKVNERLQLEANYKKLTAKKKKEKKESYGKKVIKRIEDRMINTTVDNTFKAAKYLKGELLKRPDVQNAISYGEEKITNILKKFKD